jgi:hypothetical protein
MHEKALDIEDPTSIDDKTASKGKIQELKSWINKHTTIDDIFN